MVTETASQADKMAVIRMMAAKGIENIHSEMSIQELRMIYSQWKQNKRQDAKDYAKSVTVENAREVHKDKVRVRRGKEGIIVPEDYRTIHPDDLWLQKVRGKVVVVVFNAGPKVQYDVKTFQLLR